MTHCDVTVTLEIDASGFARAVALAEAMLDRAIHRKDDTNDPARIVQGRVEHIESTPTKEIA